jgi:hypothetical protein
MVALRAPRTPPSGANPGHAEVNSGADRVALKKEGGDVGSRREDRAFAPLIGGMVAVVAAIAFAPLAQADADASNLDQIVAQAYTQFQSHCTPNMTPQFQRIVWDQGYASGGGGHGRIIDGTQGLGGPFSAWWNIGPSRPPGAQKIVPAQPSGYWDITFEFC